MHNMYLMDESLKDSMEECIKTQIEKINSISEQDDISIEDRKRLAMSTLYLARACSSLFDGLVI